MGLEDAAEEGVITRLDGSREVVFIFDGLDDAANRGTREAEEQDRRAARKPRPSPS